MLPRIKTGIPGFDGLLQGGVPQGFSLLACGAPGTGKTIFGLAFAFNGAKQFNETGLYVTIEEQAEKLRDQARQFGWDTVALEKQGKFFFLKIPIDVQNYDVFKTIATAVKKTGAKRIVLDSLSILDINASMYSVPVQMLPEKDRYYANNEVQLRDMKGQLDKQFIYLLINRINQLGATVLYLTDSIDGEHNYWTRDTVSEFVCDGVVKLDVRDFGKTIVRTIEIKKMRNTDAKPGLHTLAFDSTGPNVKEFDY